MSTSNSLRAAKVEDYFDIQRLSIQLGYQPTVEHVAKMLKIMGNHPDYEVVVAEKENQIVGWMTLCQRIRLEGEPFIQVAALVTDEKVRGNGYGRLLLNYAEEKARCLGYAFVGLHSSKRRTETHEFYKHVGFEVLKESLFFEKKLDL